MVRAGLESARTDAGATRVATKGPEAIAVRCVELSKTLAAITDVVDYRRVRIYACWNGSPVATTDVANNYETIDEARLRGVLVSALTKQAQESVCGYKADPILARIIPALLEGTVPAVAEAPACLHPEVSASIVIPTCGRPDDLRICLTSLQNQKIFRSCEIIVVDNRPLTGVTPPVVREFPGVRLVSEKRAGISYARNAGIAVSKGDIIILTDDDTIAPPDWVERLIAPFSQPEVMAVTGNILPAELETKSQCLFEEYGAGGLGRGFIRWNADTNWFNSHHHEGVRTWMLGAGANAAFRAEVFSNRHIGTFEEMLGTGMPTGAGEDLYHFYRTLKSGATITYEPRAFIWHKHRTSMADFQKQLYCYSKGNVAYHLLTFFRDDDWRALPAVLLHLALWHATRIRHRLTGRNTFPLSLNLMEMRGYLAAPAALWQSYRRVKQQGRSNNK
jgi:GT2 family glycosyltransferase